MTVQDLPALNATLNGISAVLLVTGYALIRSGRREAHKRCMLAACAASALFLASYVVYHAQVGSRPFPGQGAARTVYFAILIPHVILAAAMVPMVIALLRFAFTGRFDRHRRWARLTLPIWLYVSITGVIIYWMLYRMAWPGAM